MGRFDGIFDGLASGSSDQPARKGRFDGIFTDLAPQADARPAAPQGFGQAAAPPRPEPRRAAEREVTPQEADPRRSRGFGQAPEPEPTRPQPKMQDTALGPQPVRSTTRETPAWITDALAAPPGNYTPLGEAVVTELGNVPERIQRGFAGNALVQREGGIVDALNAIGLGKNIPAELQDIRRQKAEALAAYEAAPADQRTGLLPRIQELGRVEDMLARAAATPGFADAIVAAGRENLVTNQRGRAGAQATIDAAEATMVPTTPMPGMDQAIVSGIASLGDMAPGLAATLISRNPLPMMVYLGAYSRGSAYVDKRGDGYDSDKSLTAANLYALAEAVPEALPLHVLLRDGIGAAAKIGGTGAAEAASEVMTSGLQQLIDRGVLDEEMTWGEAIVEMRQAAAAGGVMGVMMGGIGATVDAGRGALRDRAAARGTPGDPSGNYPAPAGRPPAPDAQTGVPIMAAGAEDEPPTRPAPERPIRRPDLLTPADRASPLPDDAIAAGKEIIEAVEQGRPLPPPPAPVRPAEEAPAASAPAPTPETLADPLISDAAILLSPEYGETVETVLDMNATERAAAVAEARELGVTPLSPEETQAAIDAFTAPDEAAQEAAPAAPLALTPAQRIQPQETAASVTPPAPVPSVPSAPAPRGFGMATQERVEPPVTPEEIARAEAAQRVPRPETRKPENLMTFIVRQGGIWSGDAMIGDVRQLDYRRPGLVKTNRMVRSTAGDNNGGLTLDEMRERAEEEGFLPPGSTVADLLDLMDQDVRGDRVVRQRDLDLKQQWDAYEGRGQQDPEHVALQLREQDARDAAEYNLNKPLPPLDLDDLNLVPLDAPDVASREDQARARVRAVIGKMRGGNVVTAMEAEEIAQEHARSGADIEVLIEQTLIRSVQNAETRDEDLARAQDIPWEAPQAADPGRSGQDGDADAARARVDEDERPAEGRSEARARPDRDAAEGPAQEPQRSGTRDGGRVDLTPEGEQLVIPGAEQVPDRERAERAMRQPRRGGNAPMQDDGLFGDPLNRRDLFDEISTAAAQADPNPTDAQKEAGNYRKGHVAWKGLDITIENAKGSERTGTDSDGETWSVTMPAHYGYIKRTEGADGDHVDVYLGDKPDSDLVFVVDQVDAETGAFDEHKILLGFTSLKQATATYDAAFSDGKGPQRRGAITGTSVDEFKRWLASADTSQPWGVIPAMLRRETITPADDRIVGRNINGDFVYERADGFRYTRRAGPDGQPTGRVETGKITQTVEEMEADRPLIEAVNVLNRTLTAENKDGEGTFVSGSYTVSLTPERDGDGIRFDIEQARSRQRGRTRETRFQNRSVRLSEVEDMLSSQALAEVQAFRAWLNDDAPSVQRGQIEPPATTPETAQAADEGPAEAAQDRPAAPPPPADFATARDPLRKPGEWQEGTLLAENPDGTTEAVPAGEAVRSLMARYKLAQRLMECLDANP